MQFSRYVFDKLIHGCGDTGTISTNLNANVVAKIGDCQGNVTDTTGVEMFAFEATAAFPDPFGQGLDIRRTVDLEFLSFVRLVAGIG